MPAAAKTARRVAPGIRGYGIEFCGTEGKLFIDRNRCIVCGRCVRSSKELDGKKVKLQGKVTDVCSKMGCWFVVQGDKADDKADDFLWDDWKKGTKNLF